MTKSNKLIYFKINSLIYIAAGIASLVKGTKFNNDEKYNTGYLKEKYAKYKSKGGTYDFQTWKIKYKNQLIASGVSSLATGHI